MASKSQPNRSMSWSRLSTSSAAVAESASHAPAAISVLRNVFMVFPLLHPALLSAGCRVACPR